MDSGLAFVVVESCDLLAPSIDYSVHYIIDFSLTVSQSTGRPRIFNSFGKVTVWRSLA